MQLMQHNAQEKQKKKRMKKGKKAFYDQTTWEIIILKEVSPTECNGHNITARVAVFALGGKF